VLKRLALSLLLAALAVAPAHTQLAGSPIAYLYCWNGSAWAACSNSNPLSVTATFTPSGTQNVNVNQWDGTNLGAPSNYGTSPGAVAVPGVNAFITNTPSVALNTTPTVANGNGTVNAPSSESGAGLSTAVSSALASNLVVKASAGNLFTFNVSADSTLSGAAWWIMVFNATSLPANGAVTPAKCYAMASGTTSYSASWGTLPIYLGTGITIGVSTTGCFSLTASVHAFLSGDYK